jgi:tellurite resistance protein TerC
MAELLLASVAHGPSPHALGLWVTFAVVVTSMLAIDLGVFQKTPREPSTREALAWSGAWFALASVFGLGLGAALGPAKGLEFFTAYLVEQALSVDNLFVMMLVFAQLAVPRDAQRRVLTWGIVGCIVLRGAFVFTGTALVTRFHFLTYALGALLVVAAGKLLREIRRASEDREPEAETASPSRTRALLARVFPLTEGYEGTRFTVVRKGVRHATPLLLALVTIELADAVFALDSIPAVFGVTTDPLVVFTSNLFAVLGLRSLFFALSGLLESLVYLKHGLAVVLLAVGAKMLLGAVWIAPAWLPLVLVALVLGVAVVASLLKNRSPEGIHDAREP